MGEQVDEAVEEAAEILEDLGVDTRSCGCQAHLHNGALKKQCHMQRKSLI